MTRPLVTAEQLYIKRSGRYLIENVSLSVREEEMLTVIGPNGAGKSTLIRAILGLIKADQGSVRRVPGLRIGYMPQRLAIDPSLPLTVERFLTLPGRRQRQLDWCLEQTGIKHLHRNNVQDLSGGETQRLLLARALYSEPQLLVLDEPVQGVDVAGQVALYQLIDDIKHSLRCGVLLVSHDLHLVMASTDKVICLNRHICCEGTPDSVSRSPEFLRLFGESQSAAIASYTHHHDHTHECRPNDPEHKEA